MTTIRIWKEEQNLYRAFEVYGHAGFAKKGKDIVCSAISAITFTTINSISELCDDKVTCDIDESKGLVRCTFDGEISDNARILIDSMLIGFNQIREQYGQKFIDIIFEEV